MRERPSPQAYVISRDQPDPVAAAEMVSRLLLQGIEVHEATAPFEAVVTLDLWESRDREDPATEDEEAAEGEEEEGDGDPGDVLQSNADEGTGPETEHEDLRAFPTGSWIIEGAQPARAAVLDLIEPRRRELLHEWPDGPYTRSYDAAAYTLPMQMGVEAVRVVEPIELERRPATGGTLAAPPLPTARSWLAFSAKVTRSYQAVNRLLDAGVSVSKADAADGPVFLVPASDTQARGLLSAVSTEIGITVTADPEGTRNAPVQRVARIGLYQGWAGAMDEGWTRYMLEDFDYPYETLANDDVQRDDLGDRFDVIIIPSEIALDRLIVGDTSQQTPPEFRGGIGEEGVENLRAFTRSGGTLITLERADELAIERFGVPVRNAVSDVREPDFFLPSSLLKVELDGEHPLAMGSPEAVAAKWSGGRAYEPTGFGGEVGRIRAVGTWAADPDELLMSGQLVGAEHLAGKAAILDVEFGAGRILMYGFRVQHRAQTHGTFKLLFNALLKDAPMTPAEDR